MPLVPCGEEFCLRCKGACDELVIIGSGEVRFYMDESDQSAGVSNPVQQRFNLIGIKPKLPTT